MNRRSAWSAWSGCTAPVPRTRRRCIDERLPGLMAQLAQRGDERGLANAHLAMFTRHWLMSRAIPAAVEAKLAAEHARNAGDGGLRARALAWYLATNLYGPMPVAQMVAEMDEIEREPGEYLHAFVDCGRRSSTGSTQRFDSARTWALKTVDRFAAMGSSMAGWGWLYLSEAEQAGGDYPRAIEAASAETAYSKRPGSAPFARPARRSWPTCMRRMEIARRPSGRSP